MKHLAPQLARYGYELVEDSHDRFRFEMRTRPAWALLVGVITFPIGGFLLLFYKEKLTIRVNLQEVSGKRTRLMVHGSAPLGIRRGFAELRETH